MARIDGYGGGERHADNHELSELWAIAKVDKDNHLTRNQAEGARRLGELLSTIKSVVGDNTKTLKEHYSSPADGALYESLDAMFPNLERASINASTTANALGSAADAVDGNHTKMEEYVREQEALDGKSPQELKGMGDPATGEDGYTTLRRQILEDARNDFQTSDDELWASSANLSIANPQEFVGPKWSVRDPVRPLDDIPQNTQSDGSAVTRGSGFGGGGGSTVASGSGSGSSSDAPPTVSDGPQLQNPGGAPVPGGPTAPATNLPAGGPGGSSGPPSIFPGGTNPAGTRPFGGRPITAPSGSQRPISNLGARPTPSPAGNRPSTGAGRPMANPTARNAAPKSSLLPNQRQAASGRTPVSGSARGPQQSGSARASNAQRPAVSGGPRGGARPKPNGGFEEQLYRNTRAGRTVPSVINGAKSSTAGSTAGNVRQAAPRVSAAGKIFGERPNKGVPSRAKPKFQSGSLTDTTSRSKKDTRHLWQRVKPVQSTEPPTGSLAIARNAPTSPKTAREIQDARLAERRTVRRRFLFDDKEPSHEPASELFGGTEGRVTRSVIRGSRPSPPVPREEAGPRFSTHGWEANQPRG